MAQHNLDNLKVFQRAVALSDFAWETLDHIPNPFKFSTGDQFVRSSDSVASNIAEGYGRYGFKDKRKFFHNARGSLYESRLWFTQICKRFDLPPELKNNLNKEIVAVGYLINRYINYLNSQGANSLYLTNFPKVSSTNLK